MDHAGRVTLPQSVGLGKQDRPAREAVPNRPPPVPPGFGVTPPRGRRSAKAPAPSWASALWLNRSRPAKARVGQAGDRVAVGVERVLEEPQRRREYPLRSLLRPGQSSENDHVAVRCITARRGV